MSSTKHSSLPWKLRGKLDAVVVRGDGKHIADCYATTSIPTHEAEANAAFIVRAANCHADLVEACKLALSMSKAELADLREAGNQEEGMAISGEKQLIEKLKTALAAAQEGKGE